MLTNYQSTGIKNRKMVKLFNNRNLSIKHANLRPVEGSYKCNTHL